jgi:hypothetical protein
LVFGLLDECLLLRNATDWCVVMGWSRLQLQHWVVVAIIVGCAIRFVAPNMVLLLQEGLLLPPAGGYLGFYVLMGVDEDETGEGQSPKERTPAQTRQSTPNAVRATAARGAVPVPRDSEHAKEKEFDGGAVCGQRRCGGCGRGGREWCYRFGCSGWLCE